MSAWDALDVLCCFWGGENNQKKNGQREDDANLLVLEL